MGGREVIDGWRWLLAVGLVATQIVAFRAVERRWLAVVPLALVVVISLAVVSPSNDRPWTDDLAKQAWAEVDGDRVTVHNVRDFRYRAVDDFDAAWAERRYDLSRLERAWFVVEPFSQFEGAAHTMVTFGFGGGAFLTISVETRREKNEHFSVIRGMFRNFELIYVAGDERDLIQLRSNYRKDKVYLHPLKAEPAALREYFLHIVARMNALKDAPEFYNTLTSNCTTNLADHLEAISGVDVPSWDYRLILPGYSGELAFELGLLDTDLSLADTKKRDLINSRAEAAQGTEDFSARIRQ